MNGVFYDKNGKAIAYTEDGEHIYHFNGRPLAYFANDAVYSFTGKQLGWYENGWIRGLDGNCVLFSVDAVGGPIKPIKQLLPIKNIKQIMPIKQIKQIKKIKALKTLQWSQYTEDKFFSQ